MSSLCNPTEFKLRFTEFNSVSDDRIQIFIDDALLVLKEDVWGKLYNLGICYLTAHYLALSEDSATGNNSSVSTVASQAVDGTAISFNSYTPQNSNQEYFLSTQYGQRFYSLIKSLGSMAMSV